MNLIYMGNRKIQDHLVNWEPGDHGRGLKGRGETGRRAEKDVGLNQTSKKIKKERKTSNLWLSISSLEYSQTHSSQLFRENRVLPHSYPTRPQSVPSPETIRKSMICTPAKEQGGYFCSEKEGHGRLLCQVLLPTHAPLQKKHLRQKAFGENS